MIFYPVLHYLQHVMYRGETSDIIRKNDTSKYFVAFRRTRVLNFGASRIAKSYHKSTSVEYSKRQVRSVTRISQFYVLTTDLPISTIFPYSVHAIKVISYALAFGPI